MYYKQLNENDRYLIDNLLNIQKLSISKIAKLLNRSKSTISRELKRNSDSKVYEFEAAHSKMRVRSKHKYYFRRLKYDKFSDVFLKYYDKKVYGIKATIHKIKLDYPNINTVSHTWVYKLINKNNWILQKHNRLRRKYRKGRKRHVGIFSKFKNKRVMPIWVRPKYIDLRTEQGHWELDLVIGKRASGFANLITFTERKTRKTYIRKIQSKNPMKLNSEVYKLIKENNLVVKTITIDNGIEFEKIGLLAHWVDCYAYFCELYASYQRGSNENANGLIRRFYKKGTNFDSISNEDILKMQDLINNMPREMFNWRSSSDLFK